MFSEPRRLDMIFDAGIVTLHIFNFNLKFLNEAAKNARIHYLATAVSNDLIQIINKLLKFRKLMSPSTSRSLQEHLYKSQVTNDCLHFSSYLRNYQITHRHTCCGFGRMESAWIGLVEGAVVTLSWQYLSHILEEPVVLGQILPLSYTDCLFPQSIL